eukprot:CAMPEP_0181464138 /NCGR_PEP_ID=MMETSP1110-20121109/35274_1 /TAXON_ID=174948 /ORGANISM="Symbiodinium sp., Strain CCMP421" /LENGTH=129 /DNA_ID=CAMNT_0023588855 /DNA_START=25 /DNA_END=414 /DNA_ORIENTATION=-
MAPLQPSWPPREADFRLQKSRRPQPASLEQQQWRSASSAKAAACVRLRRNGSRKVEYTPGIEAWDSISQISSVPGTPYTGRSSANEAMSAETCDSSHAREHRQLNRIIKEQLIRNRDGWPDWHAGRVIG